jgi:hypothetical protein
MSHHPRITQPNRHLPETVREVMLAAARGGYTAFVWYYGEGRSMKSIPLMGCRPECEAWLRETLSEDHGFGDDDAAVVARMLFAALGVPPVRGRRLRPA